MLHKRPPRALACHSSQTGIELQDMKLDLEEKEAAFLELIADLQQKKGAEQKASGWLLGHDTHLNRRLCI